MENRRWAGLAVAAVWSCALVLFPVAARATGTAAGTDINSSATVTYVDPSGTPQTVSSNTATVTVDELLSVAVARNDAGNVPATTPDTDVPLSFTVTNTGNGVESFVLSFNATLGGDQFDPDNVRIYLDNGDGLFNSANDTPYVAGTNNPSINPDIGRLVFVVADIPSGRSNGDLASVQLTATAATGSGTPGTVFAGQGAGGSDAVVGAGGGTASQQSAYVISQVSTNLSKGQTVADPFGGTAAVPGATITYVLTFTVSGAGTITSAQITDPIPAGTTYVAGSLMLDSAPLTDAADGDGGRFTGTQVQVTLGTVAAPATHTIQFKVTIN